MATKMKLRKRLPESAKRKKPKKVHGTALNNRARITNGSRLLPYVDGRSPYARRLRDLITIHSEDLGGAAALSEAQYALIRRASCLTVELEHLEAKFASAGHATSNQLGTYQKAANSLRRLFESLGLHDGRRMRSIGQIDGTSRVVDAMEEGKL